MLHDLHGLLDVYYWNVPFLNNVRTVWRYQRGNQNPYIEEVTDNTMVKKKKVPKDKQRSTKHTHKTKDRVTRTQLKTEKN